MKFFYFSSVLIVGTYLLLGMKTPSINGKPMPDIQIIGTIRLEGAKQGLIMGGKDGKTSTIELNSFQWGPNKSIGNNAVNPDKAGRSESTVVVTKAIDQASVNLLQAFTNKEGLNSVEITLTKSSPDGKQLPFKIVKLSGGMIQKLVNNDPDKKHPSAQDKFHEEEITFTFTKIDMLNPNGKPDNSWDL